MTIAFDEPSLFALHARALASRWPSRFLHDALAIELATRLPPPRDEPSARELACTMLRTAVVDRWVEEFLRDAPHAAVIELGAALSTRAHRLDNGRARWFEVDSPENATAHRDLLPECGRRTILCARGLGNAFDVEVRRASGPYLFVVEGRFDALGADSLAEVVRDLGQRFPGAYLACDVRADAFRVLPSVSSVCAALPLGDAPADLVRRLPMRALLAFLWSREQLESALVLLRLGETTT